MWLTHAQAVRLHEPRRACVDKKAARASVSWLSGGFSQRQIMPQAPRSCDQPAGWATLARFTLDWGLLSTRGSTAQATEREDVRYRSVRRRRRRLCGRPRRAGRWARCGDVDVVPRRGRLRELPRQHVLLSLSRLRGAVRSAVATRPRQTHVVRASCSVPRLQVRPLVSHNEDLNSPKQGVTAGRVLALGANETRLPVAT